MPSKCRDQGKAPKEVKASGKESEMGTGFGANGDSAYLKPCLTDAMLKTNFWLEDDKTCPKAVKVGVGKPHYKQAKIASGFCGGPSNNMIFFGKNVPQILQDKDDKVTETGEMSLGTVPCSSRGQLGVCYRWILKDGKGYRSGACTQSELLIKVAGESATSLAQSKPGTIQKAGVNYIEEANIANLSWWISPYDWKGTCTVSDSADPTASRSKCVICTDGQFRCTKARGTPQICYKGKWQEFKGSPSSGSSWHSVDGHIEGGSAQTDAVTGILSLLSFLGFVWIMKIFLKAFYHIIKNFCCAKDEEKNKEETTDNNEKTDNTAQNENDANENKE